MQKLASIQKRTSPVKFDHLAEKSEKGSTSNLSTQVLGVAPLANAINVNPTLEVLRLAGNDITYKELKVWRNCLLDAPLRQLDLRSTKLTAETLEIFEAVLKGGPGGEHSNSLSTLRLGWNQLGETTAAFFARGMAVNRTLTVLDLSANQMRTAKPFFETLPDNKVVIELDVSRNEICELEIVQLNGIIADNKLVRELKAMRKATREARASAAAYV